jgi:hypothetical protein
MALDATVGGAGSNSFVTREGANTRLGDRYDAGAWVAATDANKDKVLVTVSLRIDEESFLGYKVSTTQALKFPRYDIYDEDGNAYAVDSNPEPLIRAVCIGALELLRANWLAETGLDNIDFLSTGTVQIKQFTQSSVGRLPAQSCRLLRHLMSGGSSGGRIIRA